MHGTTRGTSWHGADANAVRPDCVWRPVAGRRAVDRFVRILLNRPPQLGDVCLFCRLARIYRQPGLQTDCYRSRRLALHSTTGSKPASWQQKNPARQGGEPGSWIQRYLVGLVTLQQRQHLLRSLVGDLQNRRTGLHQNLSTGQGRTFGCVVGVLDIALSRSQVAHRVGE